MPLTFFSHQVPALLVKRWRPAWFNGTAMALGSMAPDLEHAIEGVYSRDKFGHTLPGQFLFCLPLTLLLYWLVTRLLARPLALHLPDFGGFHLRDYALIADQPVGWRHWVKVVLSALLGSFSHLGLDSFTNAHGWVVQQVPAMQQYYIVGSQVLPGYTVVQYAGSVALVGVALVILWRIGTRRELQAWHPHPVTGARVARVTEESRYVFQMMLRVMVPVALFGAMYSAGQAEPWWTLRWYVWTIFRFTALLFLALCLTGAGTLTAMDEEPEPVADGDLTDGSIPETDGGKRPSFDLP